MGGGISEVLRPKGATQGEQGQSRSTLSKMERPEGATFWITGFYPKYISYKNSYLH